MKEGGNYLTFCSDLINTRDTSSITMHIIFTHNLLNFLNRIPHLPLLFSELFIMMLKDLKVGQPTVHIAWSNYMDLQQSWFFTSGKGSSLLVPV